MIDPREKERLLEETLSQYKVWLGVLARNNASADSWQDLEQEIRIAFWKSLDRYDGATSGLGTWFRAVVSNTVQDFKRKNRNSKKRDARGRPNPAFVEQDRDELRIVEDFTCRLNEPDRQVFTMYLDDRSYSEMAASTGMDEAALRKRVSRIKVQFKAEYDGI